MKNIMIYDIEDEEIEKLCEKHDTTPAEIVEALIEVVKDNEHIIKLEDYL